MIHNRYTRPIDNGEFNCGDIKIDTIGYVSPQRQIEAILYAGGSFRVPSSEEYDCANLEECIADDESRPVRDADLIDVGKLSESFGEEFAARRANSGQQQQPSEQLTDVKEKQSEKAAE